MPPIVTRGVLLDMAAHYGVDVVKEGTAFNSAEIEAVAKKQGVEIRQGDVVIFHTGWISLIGKDDKRYNAGEPGLGVDGAKYLVSKGVVAVGADTWGVEAVPFETPDLFPVHAELLAKNGTYILENMNTGALAADKAYEFMFVLGQAAHHRRRAGDHQPGRDPIASSADIQRPRLIQLWMSYGAAPHSPLLPAKAGTQGQERWSGETPTRVGSRAAACGLGPGFRRDERSVGHSAVARIERSEIRGGVCRDAQSPDFRRRRSATQSGLQKRLASKYSLT